MDASYQTLFSQTRRRTCFPLMIGCTALLVTGCAQHLEFPEMPPPLPHTVKVEWPPSIAQQTLSYTDSCGLPGIIPVGRQVVDALREASSRTFTTVLYNEETDHTVTPNHTIKLDVRDWAFTLDKDALYDRAPAILRMTATARIYDETGALLRETEFKVNRMERLRLERASRNCDYIIDPFIQDTAVELASKLFLDTRIAFGDQPPSPPITQDDMPGESSGGSSVESSQGTAPSASPALRFKAMLLDENNNLVLEGGEHVRVRIDVVNTGSNTVHHASASITGTPSIMGQFPTTTLTIPPLQPGQTKSLEFVATLPPTNTPQQAEIHVSVTESEGFTAPSQILSLTIHPAGTSTDNRESIPPRP